MSDGPGLTDAAWEEFGRLVTPEEYAAFFAREDIWEDEDAEE